MSAFDTVYRRSKWDSAVSATLIYEQNLTVTKFSSRNQARLNSTDCVESVNRHLDDTCTGAAVDRNALWTTLEYLELAIGEEIRPIYQTPDLVRSLVSHPWLNDQVNITVAENSAITC